MFEVIVNIFQNFIVRDKKKKKKLAFTLHKLNVADVNHSQVQIYIKQTLSIP